MEAFEALLVIIILVLVYSMYKSNCAKPQPAMKQFDCVDKNSGEVINVKIAQAGGAHPAGCSCPRCSPEANAIAGNLEHFAGGHVGMAPAGADSVYEHFDVGDLSYKDFIASLSVDPQTLINHREFVRDRTAGQNQIITGRTAAMGEIEGNSSVWWGIRGRPQLIPELSQGNPTQVPDDVRETDYTVKPRFNWDSTPY